MTLIKRGPDPLFWINTGIACYPKDHPDDRKGSPFFSFWLPAGCAYVTPPEENEAKYDAILAIIEPGDPIFAYENQRGIVAMGIVKEKPSLVRCADRVPLFPQPNEIVKRFDVDWDTSITCTYSDILAQTHSVRGLALRQRDDAALHALRERSQTWSQQDERVREEASVAKLKRIEQNPHLAAKDRDALIKARIGQGRFRANLLNVEQQCRVTCVSNPTHLIASHIKPWVLCKDHEHLDGNNGLLLAPHLDHLFDKGRISFDDAGNLLISRFQARDVLRAWAVPETLNVGRFNANQCQYLAFHRRYLFEQPQPWRTLLRTSSLTPFV